MGAWGVKALENDEVLDWLSFGVSRLLDQTVISELLNSFDSNLKTLGVATIVVSLKGVNTEYTGFIHDEYAEVWGKVAHQDYTNLVPNAERVVDRLISSVRQDGWFPDIVGERIAYLNKLKTALVGKNRNSGKQKTYRVRFKGKIGKLGIQNAVGTVIVKGLSPQQAFMQKYPNIKLVPVSDGALANICIELINSKKHTTNWYKGVPH